MARFDFIESSSRAYQYSWTHRREIFALAVPALVLKILSFLVVLNFLSDLAMLRQNLVILPAYYFEGWVIASIVVRALAVPRTINVQAGAIVYVLTKLMLSFIIGMTFAGQENIPAPAESAPPSAEMFFAAIAMIAFMVWSFRFLWLYVPVMLGYSVENFLKMFKGFKSSFYMMGVWLLCLVPLGLLLLLSSEALIVIFPRAEGAPPSMPYQNAMGIVQAFIDFAMSLVASLGMAFGIYSVMSGENRTARR